MTSATQTYQNPTTYATQTLRYFVAANGRHVVVHYTHAGEECEPDTYFLASVDQARIVWRSLREIMRARGFTKKVA